MYTVEFRDFLGNLTFIECDTRVEAVEAIMSSDMVQSIEIVGFEFENRIPTPDELWDWEREEE